MKRVFNVNIQRFAQITHSNQNDGAVVDGSNNDDLIYNYGSNSTINANGGNDTISYGGSNRLIRYASGDGDDVILGGYSDTIQIISGAVSNIEGSGSDVVITVGSGSITLKNSKDRLINLQDADGSLKKIFYDGKNIIDDFIYNYNSTVDGTSGNDYLYDRADRPAVFVISLLSDQLGRHVKDQGVCRLSKLP